MLRWPCCVMFAGTVLSVHVFVYAGLSLFIINGPYLYVVVCVLYAYNLTIFSKFLIPVGNQMFKLLSFPHFARVG